VTDRTDPPKYFMIHNWNTHQQYKRNIKAPPPWIKVYANLLLNPKYLKLSDASFGQLVKLWLVASQAENKLTWNPNELKKLCRLSKLPDLQRFMDLGFIDPLTDCISETNEQNTSRLQSVSSDARMQDAESDTDAEESESSDTHTGAKQTPDQTEVTPAEYSMIEGHVARTGITIDHVCDLLGIEVVTTHAHVSELKYWYNQQPDKATGGTLHAAARIPSICQQCSKETTTMINGVCRDCYDGIIS